MLRAYRGVVSALRLSGVAEKRVINESLVYANNRREVLQHYRYLLKALPEMYPRRLQRRAIYLVTGILVRK